jgi:hypothetical protein
LWSANVIEIKGEQNWHTFLAVVIVLTVVVFACWGIYGHVSRKREEMKWPGNSATWSDTLPLFPSLLRYQDKGSMLNGSEIQSDQVLA